MNGFEIAEENVTPFETSHHNIFYEIIGMLVQSQLQSWPSNAML